MKKIGIGGVFYGLHNIGDEAILYSIIKGFRDYGELSVQTNGSEWIDDIFPQVNRRPILARYTKPKFGLYVEPRKKILQNISKLHSERRYYKEKDVYICGGATILSDCPWHSLRTAQLANSVGVPVYFFGVGMANVTDSDTLTYIRGVLNEKNVKKVFVRDEYVEERLLKIGVDKNKVFVSYDPAIMIEGKPVDLHRYLSDIEIERYDDQRKNIVLTLSGEADVTHRTPIEKIVASVLELQTSADVNVFLIPTGCGKHCKDTEMLRLISSRLIKERTVLIEKEFWPEDLVWFLKKIDLIISSRLHMNILGVCAGTPSIGLVRNEKNVDFANLVGMPFFSLETLECEQLVESAVSILENDIDIRRRIDGKLKHMRKVHANSIEMLAKEL